MATLTLRNISKRFAANTVVRDISFSVADGEFVVLVGPSGCGKSTLLRLIAGLDEVSSGEVLVDGVVVNHVPPKDRDMAMVFQNYALYPHMTVYDNMSFALKMRGFSKAAIRARVMEAARILDLEALLGRKSKNISGGQQQRVALGRAIVRNPKVFLFDEPLSNLDARLRGVMRGELIRLHRLLDATMVYVTHDQVEAMGMGDRLVVLHDGEIQQIGEPLAIYSNPANLFVAGFIGTPPMNLLEGRIESGESGLVFRGDSFSVPLPPAKIRALQAVNSGDGKIILGIRPEDIFEADSGRARENTARVQVRVDFLEVLGNEVLASCRVGAAVLVVRFSPLTGVTAGENVSLGFDLDRARFFSPETGKIIREKEMSA